jgi:transposase-like protein
MSECPKCGSARNQVRAGRNRCGTQRYLCQECGRQYTPKPKPQGYSDAVRVRAVRMYVDGANFRRIGRELGVNPQSVANWVKAHAHRLPKAPLPAQVDTVEMDELFTFIKTKKSRSTS